MPYELSGFLKKDAHVLLSISVGQDTQSGEGLNEIIETLTNAKNLKKVSILKADILQRFNLIIQHDLSSEDALELAKKTSLEWDLKNEKILISLKVGFELEILSWESLITSDEFKLNKDFVDNEYKNSSEFRKIVDRLISLFLDKLHQSIPRKHSREFCSAMFKSYILEECAIFILLMKNEKKFDYELYRTERNQPMKYLHKLFSSMNTMKELSLVMKKKPKLTQISFFNNEGSLLKNVSQNLSCTIEIKKEDINYKIFFGNENEKREISIESLDQLIKNLMEINNENNKRSIKN